MAIGKNAGSEGGPAIPSVRTVAGIEPCVTSSKHEKARIPTERQQQALKNFMTGQRPTTGR